MRHEQLLAAETCLLLVVDVQEAFAPHIPEWDRLVDRTRLAIEAAKVLGVPVMATEQYPKGLGRTVEALRQALGESPIYDKVTFSALQTESIRQALQAAKRTQLLLAGIEAHVCIAQTAFDALAFGFRPFLAVDAIGSRHSRDADVALARMREAGVILSTTEAAIMEMTVSSSHQQFRQISKLIKG